MNPSDRFVSVTSVLSVLPKPYLIPWAAKAVADCAGQIIEDIVAHGGYSSKYLDEHIVYSDGIAYLETDEFVNDIKKAHEWQRDDGGSLGDEVHDSCDKIMGECGGNAKYAAVIVEKMEEEEEVSPACIKRLHGFVKWLDENDVKPVATEFTVYNDTFGYAGSCDLAAYVNGKPYIIDFKTNKTLGKEIALQIVAYARGEYILDDDSNDKVYLNFGEDNPAGAILHIGAKACKFVEVDISDNMFECFLNALRLKRTWMDDLSKNAFLGEIWKG